MNNCTYELVRPHKKQIHVGNNWIFKKDRGIPRIEELRIKERLVEKCVIHVKGIDYNEIFSYVVKHYRQYTYSYY